MAAKTKKIVVSLKDQTLIAYEDSSKVYKFSCITGEKDSPTPTGNFRVHRKHEEYTSKTYGAKMDYAMFFGMTGEAIHKYHGPWWLAKLGRTVSDEFGSKGCVRLQAEDAAELFKWTPMNTLVIVQ